MENVTKIYLAGGLKSNWREKVIKNSVGNFIFFNPKEHGLEKSGSDRYTVWDLYHVKKCDILFGFMEKDNPSGYGLSLEIGYAKALNKCIILIDERSQDDEWFRKKYDIVRCTSSVNFNSLKAGIEYLNSFSKDKAIVIKKSEDGYIKSCNREPI